MGVKKEKVFESLSCILCEVQFDRNIKNDISYRNQGYCSLKCFRESGEYHKLQQISQLKNNGIDTDQLTSEEIYTIYRKLISERTKRTDVYNKWKSTQIQNHGEDFAVENSKLSHKTFRLNFLLENNLIKKDEIQDFSEDDLQQIFIENFNQISKRGEIIRAGRLKKYNNDLDQYKQSYLNGRKQAIINYVNKNFDTEHISKKEIDKLLEENKNFQYFSGNKTEEDKLRWKKSHLINLGIDLKDKDDNHINNLFSSYMSSRHTRLIDVETNGFKRTKKGWFNFKNIDKKIFYRSSWEEKVLEELDSMIKTKVVSDVLVPKAIRYFYNFERNYFTDFEVILTNGKTLFIEVKPFSKLLQEINVAKFKAANSTFSNFLILTENEIFSEHDLSNFILNFINGEFYHDV